MNNLKKWRFWVASPLILIFSIYIMPVLVANIINFVASCIVDLTDWIDNKLHRIYNGKSPHKKNFIDNKAMQLSKWINQ